MKLIASASALALAGLCATSVHAESSVTLYGIADISLRYLNTGAGGQPDSSRVGLANGAISNSRFGLRGVEDLGDGYSAFFRLEGGFSVQNGQQDQAGAIFNRQAFVGLDGKELGAISLGRQQTPMFTILADQYDPLTVGNYDQNAWLPAAMARVRSNNSVRYRNNKLAGFDVILSYAFSDSFTDRALGRQYGGTLSYTTGPMSFGGGYQVTTSATNADFEQRVWNLNASYNFDPVKVFAGYFNGRDQTGWVNAVMGGRSNEGVMRKDQGYYAGLTWQATPRLGLSVAAYYDRGKNIQLVGDQGKRYAYAAVADYALSKRTQVYGTIDFNRAKEAAEPETPHGGIVGLGMGIRHIF